MTEGYLGRGAWSSKGGTLKWGDSAHTKTAPGPYYMVAQPSSDPKIMLGYKVYKQLKAGVVPDLNEYAVFLAVKEIQKRIADFTGKDIAIDGLLGPETDATIKAFQRKDGLEADGIIGPKTSAHLFLPEVKKVCSGLTVDWTVVFGLLNAESQIDPGAVGYYDSNDLGLAQINGPANEDLSVEARFDTDVSIQYAALRLNGAIVSFGGNLRDAVASYNLGEGGTRTWIRAGRPDIWQPAGASRPRNVKEYIDKIVDFYKTI